MTAKSTDNQTEKQSKNIDRKDIEKLAQLARIDLSDEEAESLVKDMGSILSYVTQIQEVSATVDGTTDLKIKNVLREDKDPHESGLHTEDILAVAPVREGNYLKVKKIL